MADVEEREAGRIEARAERQPERVAVERDRAIQILRVLRDLVQPSD